MYTEIDGINVKYIDEGAAHGAGSGETILLLHGWGCEAQVYRGIIDLISPFFRVIVPDLPGFGGSDEPKEPFGVSEYADFIIKFAKKLELNNLIFIGHSLGGRIIIKIFKKGCPFEVSKIILTGSAGIKPKASFKAKLRSRIFKIARAVVSFSAVSKMFPGALDNLRNKFGSADYKAASPIMRQCLVKIVNEDLTPFLQNVTPSTLLIWGENDDSTPLSDGQLMEKLMPDAGLVVIKNAGHYAFLQQPIIFNKILASFLNIN